jgi:hypothetical protein
MTMRRKILVPILALAAMLAACDQAPPTAPATPGERSDGLLDDLLGGLLGWITNPTLRQSQFSSTASTVSASAVGGGKATASGGTYHFAFSAHRKSSGSTNGQAKLRIGSTRYDANVVCLGVQGDTAVIVGVVQSSSDAGAVGDSILFTVIDNGGDRIGEPEFPAAGQAGTRCGTITPSATTLAVDAGNIHVEGSTPVTGPVIVASVTGMGTGSNTTGLTINFTTGVLRYSNGTVSGEHREDYPEISGFLVLTPSCLTIKGDSALVGGTITASDVPSEIGLEGGVILVDRSPATANPDQSSGMFYETSPGSGLAQAICNDAAGVSLQNVTSGDLAVLP